MKYIALIPAYEPDDKLIRLVNDLKKSKFTVIVVNDGSDNNYDKIFNSLECLVLKHDINRGKGRALKTGLEYIKNNYTDYVVVTVDSDGQHKVSDALKLGEYAKNNKDTLVLGSRIRSNKTPIRSRLGNSITKFIYHFITHLDIYDTQTGLRAFSDELVEALLKIDGERFEYEMNCLLDFARNKKKIKEIEIDAIYIENNKHSHFKTIRDSYLIYKEIFKFSSISFLSFLLDYCLYLVFFLILNNVFIANISARIFSSIFNYTANKKIVFKNNNKHYKTASGYFLLALFIIIMNSLVLNIFVNVLNIPNFIAKIITELIFFVISFIVQKNFIFKENYEK